jgi:hypothetical protein
MEKNNMEDLNNHTGKLLAVYNAVVDYHNNLVHMRFTIAGLYLAANGFLVGALFGNKWSNVWYLIPILGIVITIISFLLEIRTYCLLENLGKRGSEIESIIGIENRIGFFSLMKHQDIEPKMPFMKGKYIVNEKLKYLISHSRGLELLYSCFALFWFLMLLFYR